MKRLHKHSKIFMILLLIFAILQIIYILFFKGAAGDIVFIDCAKNILKGNLGVSAHGDLYGFNKYFFGYSFLNLFLISLVFRIFGSSYNVAAIVPLTFALFNILLIYYYCSRYIGRIEAVIAGSILMFDPMFFSYASIARPEMVILFFFTSSALLYFTAEKDNKVAKIYFSGVLAGMAMLGGLNAFWLIIIFFIYKLWKKDLLKSWKTNLIYISGCMTVSLPYYGWILLSKERFNIFMMQVFINSSYREAEKLGASAYLIKSILNPPADLYLMFFRHHSSFPFILGVVLLFFIFMRNRFRYLLCVLLVPLFMMTINIRAGHYLLIIMPVCVIGLAYVLKYIRELKLSNIFSNRNKSILLGILVGIILISISIDVFAAFKKPDLRVNTVYFRKLLEENTEDNSRIVTDPVFLLANTGKRRIFNIAPLVFFPYRIFYSFDEIVLRLDMDYIILTERKYKWVMSNERQNDEFKNFLKKEFSLINFIDDHEHGKFWIYKLNEKKGTTND